MTFPAAWPRALAAALLLTATGGALADNIAYNRNLITNGDAEAGTDGWLTYDSYGAIQSVSYGNNWVRPDQPGPPDRGAQMFTGTSGYAVAYQIWDLETELLQPLHYQLSGWLGGWQAQGDNALLYVSFLALDGVTALGGAAIGPVLPADRANTTGLFYQEAEGWLPVGTSALGFWLSMERQGGGDNDGYADNLSFMLQANTVPEPSGLGLLGLGLAAALWPRLRRQTGVKDAV